MTRDELITLRDDTIAELDYLTTMIGEYRMVAPFDNSPYSEDHVSRWLARQAMLRAAYPAIVAELDRHPSALTADLGDGIPEHDFPF